MFEQYDFMLEQYDFMFEQYDFMLEQYDLITEQYGSWIDLEYLYTCDTCSNLGSNDSKLSSIYNCLILVADQLRR